MRRLTDKLPIRVLSRKVEVANSVTRPNLKDTWRHPRTLRLRFDSYVFLPALPKPIIRGHGGYTEGTEARWEFKNRSKIFLHPVEKFSSFPPWELRALRDSLLQAGGLEGRGERFHGGRGGYTEGTEEGGIV